MAYMFSDCSSLTDINLSNIITINTTNINEMFVGCSKLKKLNLSSFVTNN